MTERPAFHCGALDCCEGEDYPDCQQPADGTVTLGLSADGELWIKDHSRSD